MPIELETSEKMSRKYRIRKQKIDYILKKYKTMEQFIKLFREGALDEEDKEKLGENLNTCIDINTGVNEGYSRLLKEIMPNQAENKLLIYDSEWMTFFIDRLPKEEADVIKMSFGNYNNRNYYNLEIGKHFGISLERVRRMKERGIQKLMTRSDVIQKNVIIHDAVPTATAIQEDQTYTNEEKNRIIQIYDEIFNSNLIFCPDKEFDQEPDSITTTQIEKLVSELNWIKERASLRQRSQNEQKTAIKDETFTFIEELNVKFETYYALKKVGIINIFQLRRMTREELMLVANMQKEIVEEIEAALNEIYPEKESSKTYLEKVRASKEWLERDVERLKAEIQDAEELLAAYEAILDGNAPNNNEAKKGE